MCRRHRSPRQITFTDDNEYVLSSRSALTPGLGEVLVPFRRQSLKLAVDTLPTLGFPSDRLEGRSR
jgi:hypothetical protein